MTSSAPTISIVFIYLLVLSQFDISSVLILKMSTPRPKLSHTTYPMVGKRASDPDPKPKYGRMFLHVGAAAIMAKGFMALQGVAAAKVMQPQVGSYQSGGLY
jgi:hypothetical protein